MLKALLWKDVRIFAEVFLAGLALIVASYVFAFLLMYSAQGKALEWSKVIAGGASLTRFSSLLLCALLGAYAFARENEDHSIMFLSYLPAKKNYVAASKLTISISSMAVLWMVSLAALAVCMRAMDFDAAALRWTFKAMSGYVALGILVFGMSWLLSLFFDSVVVTALAGLMFLIPACMAQLAANWYFEIENPAFFHWSAVVLMTATGAAGVAIGTMRFLRVGGAVTESLPRRKAIEQAFAVPASLKDQKPAGHLRVLLWKDLRLIKTPLLVGLAAMLLPYAVCAAAAHALDSVWIGFRTAAFASIALGGLVFPFWSGHMTSAEYVSKATWFLSTLPVPRVKALVSKLAFTLLPVSAISALNLILLLAVDSSVAGSVKFDHSLTWEAMTRAPFIIMGFALTNGAVMGFSLSWFLSTYYARPTVAIVLGILMTPLSVGLWAALSGYCAETARGLSPVQFSYAYTCIMATAGLGLILVGYTVSITKKGQ